MAFFIDYLLYYCGGLGLAFAALGMAPYLVLASVD